MIANKKEFGGGVALMVGFWAVFVIIMTPIFNGQNLLDYMDSLYNSISKKSAYYIPDMRKKAETVNGTAFDLTIKANEQIAAMLATSGVSVAAEEGKLRVSGDLGILMGNVLDDADAMFANNGEALRGKYGVEGKQALFDWSNTLQSMEKSLSKQEQFSQSKLLYQVRTKSIEPAYNYYGIEAQNIRDKAVIVVLSLAGYVVYTMWFGFSILFMFEGWGLKLEH